LEYLFFLLLLLLLFFLSQSLLHPWFFPFQMKFSTDYTRLDTNGLRLNC
jgi:hypothetical protein